jgi:predicted nucleotide-binding protein
MVPEKDIAAVEMLVGLFEKLGDAAHVHRWNWADVIKHWLYGLPEGMWAEQEELVAIASIKGAHREELDGAIRELEAGRLLKYAMTNRPKDGKMKAVRIVKLEYAARQKYGLTAEKAINPKPATLVQTDKVFVVYGHDDEMQQTVARILERQGLDAVLLHEHANEGRVLIQKVEDHSTAGFAIVLLSPDDEGRSAKSKDKMRPRARQNVIMELGLCIGKLGRKHVFVLYRPSPHFEFPSDMEGILYSPYDNPKGNWRNDLIKEMRACHYNVSNDRLP